MFRGSSRTGAELSATPSPHREAVHSRRNRRMDDFGLAVPGGDADRLDPRPLVLGDLLLRACRLRHPRPERVLETLIQDRSFITVHLLATLEVSALGFIAANVAGSAWRCCSTAFPFTRTLLMPAAITLRNVPYVALVTVLMLAFGDTVGSKVAIVALAGFFPVLVNTVQGLRAADEVLLDRMRILNAGWWETFWRVRLPFALPTSSRPRKSPAAARSSSRSAPSG